MGGIVFEFFLKRKPTERRVDFGVARKRFFLLWLSTDRRNYTSLEGLKISAQKQF